MALIGLGGAPAPQPTLPDVFMPNAFIPPFKGEPVGPGAPGQHPGPHPPGWQPPVTNLWQLGHQFLNRQGPFGQNQPGWLDAFRQAFFQTNPGDPRHHAVSQFLAAHDPFVQRYQHFIDLLQRAGIHVPGGSGGGGGGGQAASSYYLPPLYGIAPTGFSSPAPVTPPVSY